MMCVAYKFNTNMNKIDDYLKKVIENLENADYSKDVNHKALCLDLAELLNKAINYRYHDFHKNSFDAPKMKLHTDLLEIDRKMQDGEYDN